MVLSITVFCDEPSGVFWTLISWKDIPMAMSMVLVAVIDRVTR